jgi:hypothetical protein
MKLLFAESATPSQLVLYQTEDGRARLEVRLDHETVWVDIESDGRVIPAGQVGYFQTYPQCLRGRRVSP